MSSASANFCLNDDRCGEPHADVASYDNYRLYNLEIASQEHIDILSKLEKESDSLAFMGYPRTIGQKLSILVSAHGVADFADLMKTYGIKNRVLTYNFQEKIDRNMREVKPIGSDVSKFDWNHYYHLETIYEWMEYMTKKYPNDLVSVDLGPSTQGIPIKGLKLARNPKNKSIFIESGIHAREWIAPAAATFILNELLTSRDPEVQNLANNYNWIVVPSTNPDGYKWSFEHDRMWRKNRQLFGTSRGVDLNRNFPDHWNSTGCSDIPARCDFSGSSAASEVETQRVVEYVKGNVQKENIKTYISLHSFSQMILFPYGWTSKQVPNYKDLTEFGKKAAEAIKNLSGRDYVSGCIIETIYPTSGDSMDWAYSEAGIPIAYTFELRGPPDNEDLFILPATEIEETSREAFVAIKAIVEGAAAKGYYH